MEYVTVTAPTYEAAVKKIRELYGPAARVYSRKTVNGRRRGLLRSGRVQQVEVTAFLPEAGQEGLNKENASGAGESAAREIPDITAVVEELRQVKQELSRTRAPESKDQDAAVMLQRTLKENDFTDEYSGRLVSAVFNSLKEGEERQRLLIESRAVGWIADNLPIDEAVHTSFPRIAVLMGPTGVGKTTTVAKLAARRLYGASSGASKGKVSVVSIDSYRIGAARQIETFGELLSFPVTHVSSPLALDSYLNEHAGDDLILVDTIGKSPRDQDIFDDMQRILSVCGSRRGAAAARPKFFLTLSASMKSADMLKTVERFIPFRVSSLIITKMDETEVYGNVISTAAECALPIAYLSYGQKVPQDLTRASVSSFLRELKGFTADLEHLPPDGR
jgi:flagellar biosynthesis protein FlhF